MFTFNPGKIGAEALPYIRHVVGDTTETKSHLSDEAIGAELAIQGLTVTTSPVDKSKGVLRAAVACAEAIAARLAKEAEIVTIDGGTQKSLAHSAYLRIARQLKKRIAGGASVSFANPGAFLTTDVPGIDPDPDLE